MYLTPAVTALMAWVLFDERITPLMVCGMLATAVGVTVTTRASPLPGGGQIKRAPPVPGAVEG
jgi:drug/metabolite transporter (DMT)-like permease